MSIRGLSSVLIAVLVLGLIGSTTAFVAARQTRQDYGEKNIFHDFYEGRDADLAQQRLEEMRKKRKARLVVIKCLPLGHVINLKTADPSKADRVFQKVCFADWEWVGPIAYGIVRPVARLRVVVVGDDAMPEKQPFQREYGLRYMGYEFSIRGPLSTMTGFRFP